MEPVDNNRRTEAAEWFAAQRRGAFTLDEQARFDAWRSDRQNQAVLDSMHQLWGETSALKTVLAAPRAEHRARRAAWPRAMAAGLALVVISGAIITIRRADSWRGAQTKVGELASSTLPDGSVVNLNVVTKLSYRMGDNARRVRLDSGEALFMVHKDPQRPFLVRAGSYEVRAVGTAFNVRNREGDLQVAVSEGVVSVTALDGPKAGQEIARLVAGQKIHLGATAAPAVATTPIQSVAEWRLRTVAYENASVAEVVEDLNRFFPRRLEVTEPALAAKRVNMRLQVGDRQRTLETFSALVGARIVPGDDADVLSAG